LELGYRSTNAAMKLIHRLQESGDVLYEPRRARSLRIARKPMSGVHLLGSIAAGFPDSPGVDSSNFQQINPAAFGIHNPADAFALRVRGESMIGRKLFDGDLVLLDRAATPKNQDVVAALIDQECTLKTLVIKNGKTWLKAENPVYPDLIPAHDLQIQGVAKAVIRILAA
jgi:SOS-response transcriptional repressor LexA